MKLMGQRRRSPRISAHDSNSKEEDHHHHHHHHHQNRTRSCRNKRNFDNAAALPPLSKLPKQVWKGTENPENADCVEWRSLKQNQKKRVITNGEEPAMPEKHILELILDTLQRRDTHEIFAQPVDPHQVDDYYEIIKEPMDFGTMRAKLHEGMYENLQQFEHDVFLIPENAMHFNSSATTYFRQARAIHELANKVFHVLHTNPDNFVSEFSGTRRRSMRKALITETKDIVSPIQTPSTSTNRRSNRKSYEMTGTISGDGILSNSRVADRRDTYMQKSEEDVVHSTFYSSCKPLLLMSKGEITYKDSLTSFLTDLGPTAQRVARRKLLGQHEEKTIVAAKEFKTFRDFAPAPAACNPFVKVTNEIEDAKLRHTRKAITETTLKNSSSPAPIVRDSNCSSRPVVLALENHHSNVAEFKSRNKKSCIASTPVVDEAVQQQKKKNKKKKKKPDSPFISHFTFDLPFLKARLDQMKAVEMGGRHHLESQT